MASDSDKETWFKMVIETDETDRVSDALVQGLGLGGAEVHDEQSPGRVVVYIDREGFDGADDVRASAGRLLDDQVPDGDHSIQSVEPYGDTDWETAWQAFFEPVQISPRVMVGPPWHDIPKPDPANPSLPTARLIVEPGMAFGTGTHETTQLTATLMDRQLEGVDEGPSILDVGCGSGILAIAAVTLEAADATGVDIEQDAIDAARHNAEVNGVTDRCDFSTTPVGDLDRRFPLVVANMLSHLLRDIRSELLAAVEPEGRLIISGITADEFDNFLSDFTPKQWRVHARHLDGDWGAAILQAPPASTN
jgi:ribosomal protein L11 methyltransferase